MSTPFVSITFFLVHHKVDRLHIGRNTCFVAGWCALPRIYNNNNETNEAHE
jgi:hypothetical protein